MTDDVYMCECGREIPLEHVRMARYIRPGMDKNRFQPPRFELTYYCECVGADITADYMLRVSAIRHLFGKDGLAIPAGQYWLSGFTTLPADEVEADMRVWAWEVSQVDTADELLWWIDGHRPADRRDG